MLRRCRCKGYEFVNPKGLIFCTKESGSRGKVEGIENRNMKAYVDTEFISHPDPEIPRTRSCSGEMTLPKYSVW
jgi:hypothetical protein